LPFVILASFVISPCVLLAVEITDERITDIVDRQLIFSDAVAGHKVDVASKDGIVTLTGSVDNLLARYQALQIAGKTKGVRSVVNRIEVETNAIDDDQLVRDIKAGLGDDPATESYDVEVSVMDGVVTLTGKVQSRAEKNLSERVVAGIRGVRDIKNEVEVKKVANRADAEIKNDIERRMEASAWIDASDVDAKVKDGHVILSGVVGSVGEHIRVRNAAWVAGVQSVHFEGLDVRNWAHEPGRRTRRARHIADDEIRLAIIDALRHDPRVSGYDVRPVVVERSVTLRGTVGNLAASKAAEADAWNTFGVRRVRNYLRVRPPSVPKDSRIETAIERMLSVDPYVDRFQVHVDVINGHAYLQGTVNSNFDRLRAEEVVSRAAGVAFVTNNIKVKRPWLHKDDDEMQEDVAQRLRWASDIEAAKVKVTVKDGVATLTGVVGSYQQRGLAKDIALEAGVKRVANKLTVEDADASE
jgi:osmotically-inducible protein OsmY